MFLVGFLEGVFGLGADARDVVLMSPDDERADGDHQDDGGAMDAPEMKEVHDKRGDGEKDCGGDAC